MPPRGNLVVHRYPQCPFPGRLIIIWKRSSFVIHVSKQFDRRKTSLFRTQRPDEAERPLTSAPISPHQQPMPTSMGISSLLSPGRLLRQDLHNLSQRYTSDWTTFNQLVFASAVYVFFTNLLPGITFASDLYVLTGQQWGTIEVVLSTGLCGVVFAM